MSTATSPVPIKALRGVRVLSLALNVPGPSALMRLRAMGATCTKLEPPAGDPLGTYNRAAYETLHQGVKVLGVDLRTESGQKTIHRLLARTDILLTSFRPSGLAKLGLAWKPLHKLYPALSQVAIVGSYGERAEEPGHDLTYMAENGLVDGLALPPTLYADMGGSLMASEAVLAAALQQRNSSKGVYVEVALGAASAYLGLPRSWGMSMPGGAVGGGHAGYRMYPCLDGRVAVAALEPHFAAALCQAAGVTTIDRGTMMAPGTHQAVADFFAGQTCRQLETLSTAQDIPLYTLPNGTASSRGPGDRR
jgi:alpha-methylacyl-CoA racemase